MGADHASITQLVAPADAARPGFTTAAGGVLVPADAADDTLSAFLKTTGKQSPATFAAIASLDQSIADRLRETATFAAMPVDSRKRSGPTRISSPRRSRNSTRKSCWRSVLAR